MREFKVTGSCVPEKHYMVDISDNLKEMAELVKNGEYFVINRPRQYGKTTTLSCLRRLLKDEYIVISISFQGMGEESFESSKNFCLSFMELSRKSLNLANISSEYKDAWFNKDVTSFIKLNIHIDNMCKDRKVVLIVDEVDSASNNRVFLEFLGMLRTKYLARNDGDDYTFHSVIFAGIYDIKNIKLKLISEGYYKPQNTENKRINSPWNIAADFDVDMSFSPKKIESMLKAYQDERKVTLDSGLISHEIYKYTSGYPFLVSYICKLVDEKLNGNWSQEGILESVKIIITKDTTLSDDLIKNLETYKELYDFLYSILIDGEDVILDTHNPIIKLGIMFGYIKKRNAKDTTEIANRIFETIIINYFISKDSIASSKKRIIGTYQDFVRDDSFDMELCLSKFAEHYREIYNKKEFDYMYMINRGSIFKKSIQDQIHNRIPMIRDCIYKVVSNLSATAYTTKEPLPFNLRENGEKRQISIGEKWGDLFDCAWFHIKGSIPEGYQNKHIVLIIDLCGEGCVYNNAGDPLRGITNVSSDFATELGISGKCVIPLFDSIHNEESIDFWIDSGCNGLFGNYQGEGKIKRMDIAVCNDNARNLYYDMLILYDMLHCIDAESPRSFAILYALQDAVSKLSEFTDEEFILSRECLKREYAKLGGTPSLKFSAVGHAHIDLAWLWPIRETKRKGIRTFSTVLDLMDKYPDYVFGASQAQLFHWIEEESPYLFSRFKERIKEGHIEVQGGSWVEFDTNITGGESIIRQFLYGKKYYREKFGIEVNNLWLPDTFGYSFALPQIIKKCGCDFFLTIKLSWNTVNLFPYHSFKWEGMDGSEVLVHMPPEGNYNSTALPNSFIVAQKNYQEKGICEDALNLFGVGDGGGGPGPEHLESLSRIKNMDGLPPVEQIPAYQFFNKIKEQEMNLPKYRGELYLEKHQGTLTNQAKMKRFNRLSEKALHTAELLLTQAHLQSGLEYPHEELDEIWKEVLLYQFHDILPGSSIKRVYDEAEARYKIISQKLNDLQQRALQALKVCEGKSFLNPLPWTRNELVSDIEIEIPAFGFAEIKSGVVRRHQMVASEKILENEVLKVSFADDGTITSIIDKRMQRECVVKDTCANQFVLYADIGDAWDFPDNYRSMSKEFFTIYESKSYVEDYRAIRENIYKYGDSIIRQNIILNGNEALLDFQTHIDWHEKNKMLRVEFTLNINTPLVNCDIQFGSIKRPTTNNNSLEIAQHEICAHKWIDLSQGNYGISLFNDCKYGHYAKDNVLSINLLRSQNSPGIQADIGEHEFKYALYPHIGDLFNSDVEKKAYEYNYPLLSFNGTCNEFMIAHVDQENIIIETIKVSEDDNGVIVRLYENKGIETKAHIQVNQIFVKCSITNLIEDISDTLDIIDGKILLNFKPFEINTIILFK
ncbi:MAG: glycosyl hydrolase-related protein [Oscillospiraceae bacterium]|nr:glycosyl hydrolase-related protein [Oscillospiraceae bacterium]